jgi:hypothetical protein
MRNAIHAMLPRHKGKTVKSTGRRDASVGHSLAFYETILPLHARNDLTQRMHA